MSDTERRLQITYEDASGEVSTRELSDIELAGPLSINAYCHLRNARRSFSFSGIHQIIEIESGEVFSSPFIAFQTQFGADGRELIISRLWDLLPAIRVLKFFSKINRGRFGKKETEFVIHFCRSRASLCEYSTEEMVEWLNGLWCGDVHAFLDGDESEYKKMLSQIPNDLRADCRFVAMQIARGSGRRDLDENVRRQLDTDFV